MRRGRQFLGPATVKKSGRKTDLFPQTEKEKTEMERFLIFLPFCDEVIPGALYGQQESEKEREREREREREKDNFIAAEPVGGAKSCRDKWANLQ